MTVTVNHAKTNAISDWTQAQLDEQIALGNFAPGTTLANIVLPSDWNDDHTLTGLGTMAEQNANTVAITGGSVNGTTIGATTASTGTFTTLIGGANVANYGQLTGGATTKAVEFVALGTDSNISIALDSKGTGAIDLAAGSSGVNISNGGTVTAITRTNTGSGYTSLPTVAISAPTTAGGVQAVATPNMFVFSVTVANGGTGYTVGNILTLVGGTGAAGQVTVATVSSGVITGITNGPSNGLYSALPTTPAATTGGSGSGATINITGYGLSTLSISNAGSGYIEQPTITFSGGGGSGAAAYATVGSGTTVKSIGSTMLLQTPGGTAFGVTDIANAVNYIRNQGSATGFQVFSTVQGTDTNTSYALTSKGNGAVSLYTNLGSQLQFSASHTASAVNYVQVTGSATNQSPSILMQGSDTNISAVISTKGTGGLSIYTNGISQRQARFTHTASAVNFLDFTGSIAGAAVPIAVSSSSTDTNVDLALTPKGTGLVRFGTYVAGALLATGYINIKAADGTTYKVLVST